VDQEKPAGRYFEELSESLMKHLLPVLLALGLAACSPEQSKAIGNTPKKTVDKVTSDVGKAMQQGQDSDRLKEDQK
jgi:hypothetical protein